MKIIKIIKSKTIMNSPGRLIFKHKQLIELAGLNKYDYNRERILKFNNNIRFMFMIVLLRYLEHKDGFRLAYR